MKERNIYQTKNGHFIVRIGHDGTSHYIGSFRTKGEAKAARDAALTSWWPDPEWTYRTAQMFPKGTKIGWLTVGDAFPVTSPKGIPRIWYHCTCRCGNPLDVSHSRLTDPKRPTISCGCKRFAENIAVRKSSVTGVTGVTWIERRQKYAARIMINGKSHWLGYYVMLEDAIEARKAAEQRARKERNHE